MELLKRFHLLPNDALIAATFDGDFKRVDFLELLAPE
jgi:predicted nucleic acid-binding protein